MKTVFNIGADFTGATAPLTSAKGAALPLAYVYIVRIGQTHSY